jgi:hypothetical protein
MKPYLAFSLPLALVLLSGCVTAPKLSETQTWLNLDPLQVKADTEFRGLRVDVYRVPTNDTPMVNDLQTQLGPEAPASDPSLYSWIGIDLGNGLFVDSHGNISVDLMRLYGIQEPFHIEEVIAGLIPVKVDFRQQSGGFQRKGGGTDLPDVTVNFGEDSFDLNFSQPSSKASIYIDENGVTYDAHGMLGSSKYSLSQPSLHRVVRQGTLGSNDYVAKNDNEVALGSTFLVKRMDKVIEIQQLSMLSISARPIHYVRTDSGCLFSDLTGNVYEIRRDGDTITVSRNTKLNRAFRILPPASDN